MLRTLMKLRYSLIKVGLETKQHKWSSDYVYYNQGGKNKFYTHLFTQMCQF